MEESPQVKNPSTRASIQPLRTRSRSTPRSLTNTVHESASGVRDNSRIVSWIPCNKNQSEVMVFCLSHGCGGRPESSRVIVLMEVLTLPDHPLIMSRSMFWLFLFSGSLSWILSDFFLITGSCFLFLWINLCLFCICVLLSPAPTTVTDQQRLAATNPLNSCGSSEGFT